MLEYVKLKKGDKAWFFGTAHKGDMTEGEVVHVFQLEDSFIPEYYVIMIRHSAGENFEVRDGLTVSEDPDKPIGFLRNIKL